MLKPTSFLVMLSLVLLPGCGLKPAGGDNAIEGSMLKNKGAAHEKIVAPDMVQGKALIGEDGTQKIVAPDMVQGKALIGEDGAQKIVAPDMVQGKALIGEDGAQKIVAPDMVQGNTQKHGK